MLYRCRWQVEFFSKWIKQHRRIKSFYGTSDSRIGRILQEHRDQALRLGAVRLEGPATRVWSYSRLVLSG